MSICSIYIKGEPDPVQVISDAVLTERQTGVVDIDGSDGRRTGVKLSLFDIEWIGDPTTVSTPGLAEYRRAIKIMEIIASKTDDQIRSYVTSRITDLPSALEYIIDLSVIVAALYKIVNREVHK